MPYSQQPSGMGFPQQPSGMGPLDLPRRPGLKWTDEELEELRRKMAGNIGLAGPYDRLSQLRENALPSLADKVGLGGAMDAAGALKTGMKTAAKGAAKKALGSL